MRRWAPYLLLAPGVIWLVVFFVVPLVQLVLVSLQLPYPGYPGYYYQGLGVSNYRDVLVAYWPHLLRSLVFAAVATALTFALAFPLAYAMVFRLRRWRALVMVLVVAPFFTSFILRTAAWRQILADEGPLARGVGALHLLPGGHLTETPAAVVAGLTYNFLPFMLLPVYASLERVDPSLLEAGRDLYGGSLEVLRRVTIPLAAPGILAGTLLTFIPAAGDYVNADLLGSDRSTKMIGNVIDAEFFRQIGGYPHAAALSFLLMAMILAMVGAYVRRFGTEEIL